MREFVLADFQCRSRPRESRFNRQRRGPGEIHGKGLLNRLRVLWRLQQFRAPVRENCCDLVLIFLGDKNVESRLSLQEDCIERSLGTIVGMQMKLAIAQR